ncbi:hypothetical protein MGYG_01387 [Nannizzia gypsea CBS 118893]|uniref:Uncharacterized protein n=1 Tax=Arthroderma gypseum (strain ATCC MYA-4604 / CBS 118893) TaxID=535722 RepID=E5R0L1_ARTGP|nr:hypothetical protein MGYG_01387 [Nannizzia gypsea CBS 118893]EFQ98355.1 hypothetical protein MGYG_01387 [Nannizzia gypsea CBS 118893]
MTRLVLRVFSFFFPFYLLLLLTHLLFLVTLLRRPIIVVTFLPAITICYRGGLFDNGSYSPNRLQDELSMRSSDAQVLCYPFATGHLPLPPFPPPPPPPTSSTSAPFSGH